MMVTGAVYFGTLRRQPSRLPSDTVPKGLHLTPPLSRTALTDNDMFWRRRLTGTDIVEVQKLNAGSVSFGRAMSSDVNTLVIGAIGDDSYRGEGRE